MSFVVVEGTNSTPVCSDYDHESVHVLTLDTTANQLHLRRSIACHNSFPCFTMRSTSAILSALLVAISCLVATTAFAPTPIVTQKSATSNRVSTHLNVFDEKERAALTRDSEPEDYFQT